MKIFIRYKDQPLVNLNKVFTIDKLSIDRIEFLIDAHCYRVWSFDSENERDKIYSRIIKEYLTDIYSDLDIF